MAAKKIKLNGTAIDLSNIVNFYNLTSDSSEKDIISAIHDYNYGRGIEMSDLRVGKTMEFIKLMIK